MDFFKLRYCDSPEGWEYVIIYIITSQTGPYILPLSLTRFHSAFPQRNNSSFTEETSATAHYYHRITILHQNGRCQRQTGDVGGTLLGQFVPDTIPFDYSDLSQLKS